MEKIGTGRTAEVYLTENQTVVKLFYDWVTPQHIENEVLRAKSIAAIYPQAPRYISAGNWEGRHGLEMEYIPGEMGTDYMLHNALRIRQVLAQAAAVHKEMHRTFAPALPGQVEKFQDNIAACDYITENTQAELLSFLAEREEMGFLCHGDFHPENIIVTRDGQFRVIDWLDAYRGDPMGDVARTYYLLSQGEAVQQKQSFGEKMLLRIRPILAEQYFRLYYRGEKIFEKNWLTWQLIIQAARIQEGITAETPRLHQSIRLLEKHLFARQTKE
jgi:aminoglycoside phosphotransferase (APT) family kinase protein